MDEDSQIPCALADDERDALQSFVDRHEATAAYLTGALGHEALIRKHPGLYSLLRHGGRELVERFPALPAAERAEILNKAVTEVAESTERAHNFYVAALMMVLV